VLRLRGICDVSESSRRRVESVFSPGASPGSRLTNPKSEENASLSESMLEDEAELDRCVVVVSGVVELYELRRRVVGFGAMVGAAGEVLRLVSRPLGVSRGLVTTVER
jgi:hypothetical protein